MNLDEFYPKAIPSLANEMCRRFPEIAWAFWRNQSFFVDDACKSRSDMNDRVIPRLSELKLMSPEELKKLQSAKTGLVIKIARDAFRCRAFLPEMLHRGHLGRKEAEEIYQTDLFARNPDDENKLPRGPADRVELYVRAICAVREVLGLHWTSRTGTPCGLPNEHYALEVLSEMPFEKLYEVIGAAEKTLGKKLWPAKDRQGFFTSEMPPEFWREIFEGFGEKVLAVASSRAAMVRLFRKKVLEGEMHGETATELLSEIHDQMVGTLDPVHVNPGSAAYFRAL